MRIEGNRVFGDVDSHLAQRVRTKFGSGILLTLYVSGDNVSIVSASEKESGKDITRGVKALFRAPASPLAKILARGRLSRR